MAKAHEKMGLLASVPNRTAQVLARLEIVAMTPVMKSARVATLYDLTAGRRQPFEGQHCSQ
ncbi:hypothetical protein X727_24690 [Mesorhizobium sp. L103C119B0]|uniref:hypothetical protein n=1 Tax=unclassified Mesorhizobium TaxID=325217 RepID=UPI0003D00A01|nr:hypothetical protein [Mesorhizobium sp. L103C119B0]ESZ67922.1 hypothetical protein X727_24690 [Mesorhizobium sp. L103C119B0]